MKSKFNKGNYQKLSFFNGLIFLVTTILIFRPGNPLSTCFLYDCSDFILKDISTNTFLLKYLFVIFRLMLSFFFQFFMIWNGVGIILFILIKDAVITSYILKKNFYKKPDLNEIFIFTILSSSFYFFIQILLLIIFISIFELITFLSTLFIILSTSIFIPSIISILVYFLLNILEVLEKNKKTIKKV